MPSKKHLYAATVLRGNGSEMILDALARRPWWKVQSVSSAAANEDDEAGGDADAAAMEINFNFWWGGNAQPFDFTASGLTAGRRPRVLVNRFAHQAEFCHKWRLAQNLKRYARAAGIDLATIAPHTFVLKAGSPLPKEDRELSAFREDAAACA